jgi:antitoxin ParD1/3/4
MSFVLTADIEAMINERLQSGLYDSPTEVLREGLRLLKEYDELRRIRREELRQEVMRGVEQMRGGNYRTYDTAEELGEEIIRRGMEKLNGGNGGE